MLEKSIWFGGANNPYDYFHMKQAQNKSKTNPPLPTRILNYLFHMVSPTQAQGSFRATFFHYKLFSVPILDKSMWVFTAAVQLLCTPGRQYPLFRNFRGQSTSKAVCLSVKKSVNTGNAGSFIKWSSTVSSFESQGFYILSNPSSYTATVHSDSIWTMRWTLGQHQSRGILLFCASNMFWQLRGVI